MSSQKIPLFNGVMKPVGDPGAPPVPPVTLFTPPDKNLKDGTQAVYEVHMWIVPHGGAADVYAIYARADGSATPVKIWSEDNAEALVDFVNGLPIKVLDGYPVRGDVSLEGTFECPANSAHVYGYYYRVGQGEVSQPARRFIGAAPPTGSFDAGIPISIAPGETKVIHTFEKGRIDEISLAFMKTVTASQGALLRFEDAAGVLLPSTAEVAITVDSYPNSRRTPPSPYNFYQTPLGGSPSEPTLAKLSVRAPVGNTAPITVNGYFTRH